MDAFTIVGFLNCTDAPDGNIVEVISALNVAEAISLFFDEYSTEDTEIVTIFKGDVTATMIQSRDFEQYLPFYAMQKGAS